MILQHGWLQVVSVLMAECAGAHLSLIFCVEKMMNDMLNRVMPDGFLLRRVDSAFFLMVHYA